MAELKILEACAGINNVDSPIAIGEKYLSGALNVDVGDSGDISRRDGFSVLSSGHTAAHSLYGFLNKYAIYADGTELRYFDLVAETGGVISSVTAGKPVSYTTVGSVLVYSNGVERGTVEEISGSLVQGEYFPYVDEPVPEGESAQAFPLTDYVHFFNGSMYGVNKTEEFLYCSKQYRPGNYNPEEGNVSVGCGVNWIRSFPSGLLLGTDAGIVALAGHGIADFEYRLLTTDRSLICSEVALFDFEDGSRKVLLAVCDDGIYLITEDFFTVPLTRKIDFDWFNVTSGAFLKVDNNYIFSGVTT